MKILGVRPLKLLGVRLIWPQNRYKLYMYTHTHIIDMRYIYRVSDEAIEDLRREADLGKLHLLEVQRLNSEIEFVTDTSAAKSAKQDATILEQV